MQPSSEGSVVVTSPEYIWVQRKMWVVFVWMWTITTVFVAEKWLGLLECSKQ